jgi:uncharacterized protein (TIGR03083 family)
MEIPELIDAIRREGDLMATAADKVGADTPIPSCPEWCMRDLVRHQGEVHRWATAILRDRLQRPDVPEPGWPDDDELVSWFRDGCAALVGVLDAADTDLDCFAFLPAPSAVHFWARRQAHETGIHRADAELAVGPVTPFDAGVAVDGIEEMLYGFASRSRSKLRSPTPVTLSLHATDADAAWRANVDSEHVEVTRGDDATIDADCVVRAGSSDLFLLLWNRAPRSVAEITGDPAVLDLWLDTMQIRWS